MLKSLLEKAIIDLFEASQKVLAEAKSKRRPSPMGFHLGKTSQLYNNRQEEAFYISPENRQTSSYLIGGSGYGKTSLLESYLQDDTLHDTGWAIADCHGDVSEQLIKFFASIWQKKAGRERDEFAKRIIIVEPFNPERIIGFNPLEVQQGNSVYSCVLEMMNVFKARWPDFGPRMEELFRATLLTLSENNLTLLEIPILLTNREAREALVKNISNEEVRSYWLDRYNKLSQAMEVQYREPVLNKVTEFLTEDSIRCMLGQTQSTLDFRKAMDQGRFVILNIAKGKLKSNSSLLGGLFLAKLQLAALSRVDMPFKQRRQFHLVLDEFQNFLNSKEGADVEVLLSECRKYRVHLTLAHQNLGQLNADLLNSILGNINALFFFRLGYRDALALAPELNPADKKLFSDNLIKLKTGEAYVKLKGKPVRLVKIRLPDSPYVHPQVVDEFKKHVLSFCTRPLKEVKREIDERHRRFQVKEAADDPPIKLKNPLEGQNEW